LKKTAKDIMTRKLIMVKEDMMVNDLIELFLKNKISCAPVVDRKKKLIGIVTKTDIIGRFMDLDLDFTLKVGLKDILDSHPDPSELKVSSETESTVGQIMTPNPITASENTAIEKLAEVMIENGIHRLIIKEGGKIVGIVSTLDMLYYIAGKTKNE
jgi:CBS domain-containing protein